MKEGKSWKTTFCGKFVSNCPTWKEGTRVQVCPRFHIGTYCFKDCIHANCHVGKAKIPQDKVVAFKDYMKTIWSEH
eukprot:10145856-Ditylum_brightwellii.AAC.1